jgi:ADP-ribosylglycohydrolase
MTTENDRIAGVLLGQAAGDALGSQYEFGSPSNGHAVMGRGTFGHAPGEYTDDTQQAVCVARAAASPRQSPGTCSPGTSPARRTWATRPAACSAGPAARRP